MNQNNDNNNALIAFFGGIVAGAAIGVMLAPGRTSDTLKRVADTAQRIGGDVISLAGRASEMRQKFVQGDFIQKAEVFVEGVAAAKELKEKITGHHHSHEGSSQDQSRRSDGHSNDSSHRSDRHSHDGSHTEDRSKHVSSQSHKSGHKSHKSHK